MASAEARPSPSPCLNLEDPSVFANQLYHHHRGLEERFNDTPLENFRMFLSVLNSTTFTILSDLQTHVQLHAINSRIGILRGHASVDQLEQEAAFLRQYLNVGEAHRSRVNTVADHIAYNILTRETPLEAVAATINDHTLLTHAALAHRYYVLNIYTTQVLTFHAIQAIDMVRAQYLRNLRRLLHEVASLFRGSAERETMVEFNGHWARAHLCVGVDQEGGQQWRRIGGTVDYQPLLEACNAIAEELGFAGYLSWLNGEDTEDEDSEEEEEPQGGDLQDPFLQTFSGSHVENLEETSSRRGEESTVLSEKLPINTQTDAYLGELVRYWSRWDRNGADTIGEAWRFVSGRKLVLWD